MDGERKGLNVTDIDDRKMAEEKLRRDEQELRRMTDTIPQHIMVLAPDGTAVHAPERDQTDTASLRHRRPRIFAALLAGIGLVLIVGAVGFACSAAHSTTSGTVVRRRLRGVLRTRATRGGPIAQAAADRHRLRVILRSPSLLNT